ncbi:MAG: hypothetical protein Q4A27_03085 [bacterium]|nr:hypothetical protein [bacterium]
MSNNTRAFILALSLTAVLISSTVFILSSIDSVNHHNKVVTEARKILKTKEAVVNKDDSKIYMDFLDENSLDYTIKKTGSKFKIIVDFPE